MTEQVDDHPTCMHPECEAPLVGELRFSDVCRPHGYWFWKQREMERLSQYMADASSSSDLQQPSATGDPTPEDIRRMTQQVQVRFPLDPWKGVTRDQMESLDPQGWHQIVGTSHVGNRRTHIDDLVTTWVFPPAPEPETYPLERWGVRFGETDWWLGDDDDALPLGGAMMFTTSDLNVRGLLRLMNVHQLERLGSGYAHEGLERLGTARVVRVRVWEDGRREVVDE